MRITSIDSNRVEPNVSGEVKGEDLTVRNSELGVRTGRNPTNKGNLKLTKLEKNELPVGEKFIIDSIEKANRAVSIANRRFEYSIHEKTKHIMVKVIDIETEEVVREIPPEKTLDLVAMIWEMAGLIVDERR